MTGKSKTGVGDEAIKDAKRTSFAEDCKDKTLLILAFGAAMNGAIFYEASMSKRPIKKIRGSLMMMSRLGSEIVDNLLRSPACQPIKCYQALPGRLVFWLGHILIRLKNCLSLMIAKRIQLRGENARLNFPGSFSSNKDKAYGPQPQVHRFFVSTDSPSNVQKPKTDSEPPTTKMRNRAPPEERLILGHRFSDDNKAGFLEQEKAFAGCEEIDVGSRLAEASVQCNSAGWDW
ncbi:hypothetical protein GOBAR_DD06358 [Gossypium barbadense]|nr:hypothetical protein GOBAR_DD06358 [Gossypium barbadense]